MSSGQNILVLPISKHQQRKARKLANVFTRKPLLEDSLTSSLRKMNLGDPSPVYGFDDMGLTPNLLKGIAGHGLERPAVCQQTVILPMIQGRDVICQAQSGMGKTAAFCISVLQRLESNRTAKALVLAPTRELAEQILEEFATFAKFMGVKIISCIGGVGKFKLNLQEVESGDFHVAVGTLGRIAHLINFPEGQGLNGDAIKMFVIDEADKMVMDNSFRTDLGLVISKIAADAQVIVTSATMPSPAYDRIQEFTRSPFTFLLRSDQLTLDGIKQFHVRVGNQADKLDTMNELFPIVQTARGIIFCNTRRGAEDLATKMKGRGHIIEGMTGTMEQGVRKNKLTEFKVGRVPALIASDLLGRGVDIHHVQLVINYDMPKTKEEYIHRIGRAGRYGKKGVAITFVTDLELQFGVVQGLETFYQTQIPQLPPNIHNVMNELK